MKEWNLRTSRTLWSFGVVALCACQPRATQSDAESPSDVDLKHPALEADNNDFIVLTGTVVKAGDDEFELDYGNGWITVEMDDYDEYPEGKHLFENDRVVVYGYVDDDFYEERTIEAQSVYVRNLGTQFYASGADEEDFPLVGEYGYFPGVAYRGEIISIVGDEFTLDTGTRQIKVGTSSLPYNPLDAEGYQRLEEGDRVYVTGPLDADLFELNELEANSIIELSSSG